MVEVPPQRRSAAPAAGRGRLAPRLRRFRYAAGPAQFGIGVRAVEGIGRGPTRRKAREEARTAARRAGVIPTVAAAAVTVVSLGALPLTVVLAGLGLADRGAAAARLLPADGYCCAHDRCLSGSGCAPAASRPAGLTVLGRSADSGFRRYATPPRPLVPGIRVARTEPDTAPAHEEHPEGTPGAQPPGPGT